MDNGLRHRILYLILASVMLYSLIVLGFKKSVINNPFQSAVISLSFFSVIAIIIITLYPELLDPNRKISTIDDYIMIISSATFTIVSISLIDSFGTDDMEYIYEALNNLFSGKDPYTAFYTPYGVCPTYTIYGTVAHNFVYPPLSFIIYIPLYIIIRLLNLPAYTLNIENVLFDIILVLLIYLEGRKKEDPFVLLPVIFLYVLTTVSIPPFYGVIAVIPAVFLLLSYLNSNKIGGISLALATSFNQLSWLALPFILIYKSNSLYKGKIKAFLSSSYMKSFLITLLITDLPFLLWNPKSFIYNVITTDSNTIPVGQIGLTVFSYSGLFQLEPWFFDLSLAIVMLLLIYFYMKFFEIVKESLWVYPLILSWFLWRTLTEYFFIWIPLLFVSLLRINEFKLPPIRINLKKDILIPLFLVIFTLSTLGVYAHINYVQNNPIKIESVYVLGNPPYSAIIIKVKNVKSYPVNITLVRVSLPNNLNMVWNFTSTSIPPNSSSLVFAYAPYQNMTINSTVFTVQVYSDYYFSSYKVNTTTLT
jgi:uncharacterized membrane protein